MESTKFVCSECKQVFGLKQNFNAHLKKKLNCNMCNEVICTSIQMRKHRLLHQHNYVDENQFIRHTQQNRYHPYHIRDTTFKNYGQQIYQPQQHCQQFQKYPQQQFQQCPQQQIYQPQQHLQHQQYPRQQFQQYPQQQLQHQHHNLQQHNLHQHYYQQQQENEHFITQQQHYGSVIYGAGNPYQHYPYLTDVSLPSTSRAALHIATPPPTDNLINLNNEDTSKSMKHDIQLIISGFNNRIAQYRYTTQDNFIDINKFLPDDSKSIKQLINNYLTKHNVIKFNMELAAEYVKFSKNDLVLTIIYHTTKMVKLTISDDINDIIKDQLDLIKMKMSEFQERDSGWSLLKIEWLDVNVNKCALIRGSQYIPTPKKLLSRNACINIKNIDIYCFKWCVIAAFGGERLANVCIPSTYNINNISADIITLACGRRLNFSNMKFPLEVREIKIFERNNEDISVNVFGYDDKNQVVIGPYYITKEEKVTHINLLLLEDVQKSHYILVKDISR